MLFVIDIHRRYTGLFFFFQLYLLAQRRCEDLCKAAISPVLPGAAGDGCADGCNPGVSKSCSHFIGISLFQDFEISCMFFLHLVKFFVVVFYPFFWGRWTAQNKSLLETLLAPPLQYYPSLVFGLELKYLVLWQFLLPTCAAPTHAQMHLGNTYIINLTVTPTFGGGSQKCTQSTP